MTRIYNLIIFTAYFSSSFAQNSWQDQTKIADSLQLNSEFIEALRYRNKAVDIAKSTQKDTIPFLELLKDISQNEAIIKDKDKSDEAYKKLHGQIKELEKFNSKPERVYSICNRLYKISSQNNDIKNSDYFITKSLEFQYKSKSIDSLLLLETLQNAGTTYRQIGKLDKAVIMFKTAEKICKNLKIKDAYVLGLNYMSLSELYRYRYLDDPKKFIKYLQKAQLVYEQANAVDEMIRVYFGLSDFMSNGGKFKQSINYLKKAFEVYNADVEENKKLGVDKKDFQKELKFHNYFIEKYRIVGNEKLMLYHLNEMLQFATPKLLNDNAKDLISLSHLYLAEYYENENDDKALAHLNEGSKFFPTKDLYNIREEYDMHYAAIFINKNEYDKAEIILNDLSKKKGLPLFIAKSSLEKRIVINAALERFDEAYAGINTILERYFDADSDVNIRTLTYKGFKPGTVLSDTQRFLNLAQAFERTSKDQITETLYWLALKQFESNLRQEILNDRINTLYSDICLFFYIKASKGAMDKHKLNQFLAFTGNIESKHLLNTFVNNRTESKTTKLDGLIKREQAIRANLTFLKKQNIVKVSDSINQLIFEDNLRLEKIDAQLKLSANSIAALVNTDHTLEQIKSSYVIKYKNVNNHLFRIEFNKGNGIVINEIEDFTTVKNRIIETLRFLKTPGSTLGSITKSTDYLFNKLLKDTQVLNLSNEVYIIPDDVLHYLPFEFLTTNNKYLLEQATVSYATALSFINNNLSKQEILQEPRIALFAPSYKAFAPSDLQLAVRGEPYYLEGTLKEVNLISKLFSNSDLYINDKASKESFKNLSNNYSILHLSMHSFINDQDSELSSLVFSDKDKDYELYISELYGLNLNADMAVLSACNTGVGELKTGQGVVSMNTAFTAAGVPSVLSSLWSAPDEATQKIMTLFYKNLKKGETKNTALKNAKLDYLNTTDDPNLKHPYYWAGFILTGDTSAIVSPTNYWLYAIVSVALILIFFIVAKRRLKLKS